MVIVLPMTFAGGYFTDAMAAARAGAQVAFATQLGWAVVGYVVFALVQAYPLARTAQTWGKRALGIRIVALDGSQPSLARLLLRRYLPIQGLALIPLLGNVAAIVNALLIFRTDRRCGHDLIAGTEVLRQR